MRYELTMITDEKLGETLQLRANRPITAHHSEQEILEASIRTLCNIESVEAVAHVVKVKKSAFADWDDIIPVVVQVVLDYCGVENSQAVEVANLG